MDIERNVFLKWLNEETGKKGLLRLKELIDKDCYIEKILGLECFMEAVEKKKIWKKIEKVTVKIYGIL